MAEVRPVTALLDVNVVLDVLLQRDPFFDDSKAVWGACDAGRFTGFLAATTFTNIYYIVRRSVGHDRALRSIGTCLQAFAVAPVDQKCVTAAFRFSGRDFEDNVQIAAAAAASLQFIVTRDPADFAASPVPVLTPVQFLTRLAQPDP